MPPLCDTKVIGELSKARPDPRVVRWARAVPIIALSTVSLEEIFFGLAARPKPRERAWMEAFLARGASVLPVTPEIARRAGEMRGALRAQGQVRQQADMLIAATAQVHSLTLVTRHVRDFEGLLIPLLNPFSLE